MTLKITDLMAKKCALSVDVAGNAVQLSYRPNVITPEKMAELQKLPVQDSLVKQICLIVSEWDIEKEAGKPLPITEPELGKVPVEVLTAVLHAINHDSTPGEEEKNA
jgi:hypothetical protein